VNILLDTCTFLWLITDAPELSANARRLFSEPENDVYLSVASAWEIIVQHQLGKLPLQEAPHDFICNWRVRHGIETLPLDEPAVLQLSRLPDYHRDTFDWIIICQAIANCLVILTPDNHITRYPVRTEW
jgi:PIN domain nuclease of toxin-antitoxin system